MARIVVLHDRDNNRSVTVLSDAQEPPSKVEVLADVPIEDSSGDLDLFLEDHPGAVNEMADRLFWNASPLNEGFRQFLVTMERVHNLWAAS